MYWDFVLLYEKLVQILKHSFVKLSIKIISKGFNVVSDIIVIKKT